jgi:hypothetical protein
VLVFGLIPDLDRTAIDRLTDRIPELVGVGGLLWMTAHTTEDPAFDEVARLLPAAGRNSFHRPEGGVRTYLEAGELTVLLPDWKVLHVWEGLGPVHRHGNGPPERHGRAEIVLRRPIPQPSAV